MISRCSAQVFPVFIEFQDKMIDKNRPKAKANQYSPMVERLEVDALKMLRRHWVILLACLVLGWAAAAAYYVATPPTYESQANLLLMPKNAGLSSRGMESSRDVNSTLSDDLLATHMMLIQSSSIVKEGLRKADLLELPSLVESMSKKDRTTSEYVIGKLYVSRGGEGKAKSAQVLKVAFRHGNAEDAKKVVTAIVDEFRQFIDKKYADVNQSAAELIEKAQGQLKSDLEIAESSFRTFREDAPMLWNGDKSTNVFRTEYEQIESSLTDLRMHRTELESRQKLVESQLKMIHNQGGSDIEKLALIDEKSAERIRIFLEIFAGKAESQLFQSNQPARLEAARGEYEGLLKLKSRLQSLIADFGDEQPEVRSLKAEIKTIEEFLKQRSPKLQITSSDEVLTASMLVDAYVSLLHHDIEALSDREQMLVESSQEAENEAKELVQYELQGETLRLAVDRQKVLFDATVDRLREINLAKEFGGFVNELILEPEIGEEVSPKISICGLLGTMGGLLLGCMGAFVSEIRDRSIRTVGDVEKISGVPNVSFVPLFEIQKQRKSLQAIAASGSMVSPVVVTHHFPSSRESEVFRGLRTVLMFKTGAEESKVIAVTSPSSGDGKSTVLSNLAVSLAQAGRRVLLIDADMRRPMIGKIFGVATTVGLSDLLTGNTTLFNAVTPSDCSRLDLLVSGSFSSNPAELLSSAAFPKLLELARSEYDIVLLDCPPVLAVADPCVVSSIVDSILLVLRVNPKSRIELQRTMDLLSEVKGNVFGTIVNASQMESAEGGKLEKYGVGYGYGTYGSQSNNYFQPAQNLTSQPMSLNDRELKTSEPKTSEGKVRMK